VLDPSRPSQATSTRTNTPFPHTAKKHPGIYTSSLTVVQSPNTTLIPLFDAPLSRHPRPDPPLDMATVCGPTVARHPGPSPNHRRPSKATRATPTSHPMVADPYYGHEETAKICARFVTHLFACPEHVATTSSQPAPPLPLFIAYALHRTRLHSSVTFAALYLLQRLKARFPAARGSSGHRLFISAFMLASKVICDDTYSNKSWSIVGQGMFALREINQMEREMCSYLEWQLNVEPTQLKEFESKVRRDFKGPGPYPNYVLPSPAPSPMPSTSPYVAGANPPPPSFVTGRSPSTSPPKPATTIAPSSRISTEQAYLTPPTSPDYPDTPDASHSVSTSPASSGSPPTPPGYEDHSVEIVSADAAPPYVHHVVAAAPQKPAPPPPAPAPVPAVIPVPTSMPSSRSHRQREPSISQPVKRARGCADLFAFASPISW